MSGRKPADVQAALEHTPPQIRGKVEAALELACGGDWRRVTVESSGKFAVQNQPTIRRVELKDPKPVRARLQAHDDAR